MLPRHQLILPRKDNRGETCDRDRVIDQSINQSFENQVLTLLLFWLRAVFSPDSEYVCVGSNDGTVFIWNVNNPSRPETCLREHDSSVIAVAWQPAGNSLTSSDRNKRVVVWADIWTRRWRQDSKPDKTVQRFGSKSKTCWFEKKTLLREQSKWSGQKNESCCQNLKKKKNLEPKRNRFKLLKCFGFLFRHNIGRKILIDRMPRQIFGDIVPCKSSLPKKTKNSVRLKGKKIT